MTAEARAQSHGSGLSPRKRAFLREHSDKLRDVLDGLRRVRRELRMLRALVFEKREHLSEHVCALLANDLRFKDELERSKDKYLREKSLRERLSAELEQIADLTLEDREAHAQLEGESQALRDEVRDSSEFPPGPPDDATTEVECERLRLKIDGLKRSADFLKRAIGITK